MTAPDNTTDKCCQSQPDRQNSDYYLFSRYWRPVTSLLLLISGLALEYLLESPWFTDPVRIIWYLNAYIPVGLPVLNQALEELRKGEIFTEFFLMGIATIGAFIIGEYPEGVAVMLFYTVGEAFQQGAVDRAKGHIRALLDIRPDIAHLVSGERITEVHPKTIRPGEMIQVRPGERVPLDGILKTGYAAFDTSALTGESRPRTIEKGGKVLAGMINLQSVIHMEVSSVYEDSSISRILEMVKDAAARKAPAELFIRKFARIYTPVVVALAVMLVTIPALVVETYHVQEWVYRGLVFLVISCPCALVISIPLGYFGGIGAASRNGILVKGGNYLDALRSVSMVVFDKTGTLTKGTFSVQDMQFPDEDRPSLIPILYHMERSSTHPVARAITRHIGKTDGPLPVIENQKEIFGSGVKATVNGQNVLVGSRNFMESQSIAINGLTGDDNDSIVYMAVNGRYRGHITISDELKEDSARAVAQLRELGIKRIVMLSGDSKSEARRVGKQIGADEVFGDLLPEQKAARLKELRKNHDGIVAYVGDGINDAPVLALSDVGIAMGSMGSDAAIETADVIIQTDQPSRIATAVKIARVTRRIVWQNVWLALGIKALILALGAFGLATLWGAVFADVGVALLAILNAVRVQRMVF